MQEKCFGYEKCMQQGKTGQITILAESLGEMVETFLYTLSLSTVAKLTLGGLGLIGAAFVFLRIK